MNACWKKTWIAAAVFAAAGAALQLPPDMQADRYLLQAFFFRYAEVVEQLGLYDEAIAAATKYLTLAGRDGAHYRDALRLLNSAEAEKNSPIADMEFVRVPAGEFLMGSASAEARGDERPLTLVRISQGFSLGKYEVPQAEWQAVMGNNPSNFQHCGPNCPVENVSWNDVQRFIGKLNAAVGDERYRLPTEAEWEYAARAGIWTDTPAGGRRILGRSNASLLDGIAWYAGNSEVSYAGGHDCSFWDEKQYASSRCGPHPVGLKAPNEWGLHDMLGNVWEWTRDWYGDYPGGSLTAPRGPGSGSGRVSRGGGWVDRAGGCRVSARLNLLPGDSFIGLGFRLLRTE